MPHTRLLSCNSVWYRRIEASQKPADHKGIIAVKKGGTSGKLSSFGFVLVYAEFPRFYQLRSWILLPRAHCKCSRTCTVNKINKRRLHHPINRITSADVVSGKVPFHQNHRRDTSAIAGGPSPRAPLVSTTQDVSQCPMFRTCDLSRYT
jgi:hypothetical protein